MGLVELPYLHIYRNRHGREYAYYRRGGLRWRIHGEVGSPAFLTAYQQRHAAFGQATVAAEAKAAIAPGSLADLIRLYRQSPEWRQLKPASRADYEKALGPLHTSFGHCQVATLQRQHVRTIRDLYATRPVLREGQPVLDEAGQPMREATNRRANKVVTVLSILMTLAIDLEWRRDNPASHPKKLKTGPGYRAWTAAEIAAFEAHAPELRTALVLALATGQRSGDLVRMARRDFDGSAFHVVQEKTGADLWIPAHPIARAALDAHLAGHDAATLLAHRVGEVRRAWEPLQFQTAVSKAIRAAGLPRGVVWHGLRHTAASWLAEAGCSEREIMAITGHTTAAMVSKYTKGADQKRRAASAIAKLERRWKNTPET